MKIERAIFLDIDGVLATVREHSLASNAKTYIKKYNVYPFNPKCVKVLNELLYPFNPVIVLTSDWREHYTMKEMVDIFNINEVAYPPTMRTESIFDDTELRKEHNLTTLAEIRGYEIKMFLKEHEVDKFAVIDDLNMRSDFGGRFIHCTSQFEGIKKSGLQDQIFNLLE